MYLVAILMDQSQLHTFLDMGHQIEGKLEVEEKVNKAIIFNILLHSDIRVDLPGSDLQPKLKD
jgi:hypothetical protein